MAKTGMTLVHLGMWYFQHGPGRADNSMSIGEPIWQVALNAADPGKGPATGTGQCGFRVGLRPW